ncbi:16227_t:CDS:1 [Acaulospora morrowiae]|uniref:16227_t:CDS:1 n=1 Tax=Acaulospora morrowiae TaxID=94023 RepID=A0A9N9ERR2_9GLOM|nr:16227_t:CDS:1 [Acaulospora morrowiae]
MKNSRSEVSKVRLEMKQNFSIELPFPPDLTQLESKKKCGAFIIYRRHFSKMVGKRGIKLTLAEMSRHASRHWKKEPANVKGWYKDYSENMKKELIFYEYTEPGRCSVIPPRQFIFIQDPLSMHSQQ